VFVDDAYLLPIPITISCVMMRNTKRMVQRSIPAYLYSEWTWAGGVLVSVQMRSVCRKRFFSSTDVLDLLQMRRSNYKTNFCSVTGNVCSYGRGCCTCARRGDK
jgi:hypothetical protein